MKFKLTRGLWPGFCVFLTSLVPPKRETPPPPTHTPAHVPRQRALCHVPPPVIFTVKENILEAPNPTPNIPLPTPCQALPQINPICLCRASKTAAIYEFASPFLSTVATFNLISQLKNNPTSNSLLGKMRSVNPSLSANTNKAESFSKSHGKSIDDTLRAGV